VVVDARIPTRGWGGVQQVAIGLATGHASVAASDVDLLYVCYPDGPEWLLPNGVGKTQMRIVAAPPPPPSAKSWAARNLHWLRGAYHALSPTPPIPTSNGYFESLAPDIVHFPHQSAFLTGVMSIYHPHDLQHLHLPEYFTKREIRIRESRFRAFCNQAALVAVGTTWVRDDVIRAYGLPPEKIGVVPLAPVVGRYPELDHVATLKLQRDRRIPDRFCFYPAQTWPHKNHEMLLKSVARLRAKDGLSVPLVFSGAETSYIRHLRRIAANLGIADYVRWLGFVEPAQLRALYRLATCVVVPTLFESASFPIFEAFECGVPVACSNVTALPKQVGDAAIIFDPRSVDEIAAAINLIWTDTRLREDLARRGKARIAAFSWERTARLFTAHYRRLAGRDLTEKDHALLAAEPII
jgi:glycosyltransferase involved in cell wall biosynthesis